ncbi:MAG: DUF5615 family PIN-like protein [Endozoicomonas sp.]
MLLLDENLSPRLVARIEPVFPGTMHVLHAGLDNSPDIDIWHYAAENALTIVSKDKDFLEFASLHGMPPHLIHLSTGNARISVVEEVILGNRHKILQFIDQVELGVLLL